MVLACLETAEEVVEQEWCVEGIPVLSARISLPTLGAQGKKRPLRQLEGYYRQYCRAYLRYCEGFLLPRAEAEFRQALAASSPLPRATVALGYEVTYNENGLWSLFSESLERGLGPSLRVRRGDCWRLDTGTPVPLSALFPSRFPCRRLLTAHAAEEIQRQLESGSAFYKEGWQRLLRRELSSENFYITPEGLHFFYQMYTIAPGAEGVPTFFLPWADSGPRLPA